MLPPFLAACRRQPVPHTPIWIMRQAGRYLPEYRALRAKYDFLTVMRTPELAAEATLQPIRRFPLDAAILFADIMTPLDDLGLGLSFAPGPVLERPVRGAAEVDALADSNQAANERVTATIRAVRAGLAPHVPLIGFAGAPFTLFCYLVEGRSAPGFRRAVSFLDSEPEAAARLFEKLARLTIAYLAAQARAGAQALMVFDTWADLLEPATYERVALPGLRAIFSALEPHAMPRIYFPRSSALLPIAATLPIEVMGIDWRSSLASARTVVGPDIAVQGNLAPTALLETDASLDAAVDEVLRQAGSAPGHIFNLGHGIDARTDPERVARLVDRVHRHSPAVQA